MSFEKLLKEKKQTGAFQILLKEEYITIKDLGNWAWTYCMENFDFAYYTSNEPYDIGQFESDCYCDDNRDLWCPLEIAIACLGKDEIERRLKNLKKVSK